MTYPELIRTVKNLPFAQLYGDDDKQDWLEFFEVDLVYFGPAAIPHLQQAVSKDSGGKWHYGRGLIGATLQKIATHYPETAKKLSRFSGHCCRLQKPSLQKLMRCGVIGRRNWDSWRMRPAATLSWL